MKCQCQCTENNGMKALKLLVNTKVDYFEEPIDVNMTFIIPVSIDQDDKIEEIALTNLGERICEVLKTNLIEVTFSILE